MKYRLIIIDCPWTYEDKATGGDMNSAAEQIYPVMSLDEIKKLPIKELLTDDGIVFAWATVPLLPDQLEVVKAWGLTYKTMKFWDKVRFGMGRWFRGQVEPLIVAAMPKTKPMGLQERNIKREKRRKHSAKPRWIYETVNKLRKPGEEVLEIFARGDRPEWVRGVGFDAWGGDVRRTLPMIIHETELERRLALRNDFIIFSRKQLETQDVDPAYPLLRAFLQGEDDAKRWWMLVLYLTYYNLGSAEKVWRNTTPFAYQDLPAMPTGVERRGMRGNAPAVIRFVKSVCEQSLCAKTELVAGAAQHSPETRWQNVRRQIEKADGAGPWASYKWADLVKNVMGFDITADDIGIGGGGADAGPVPGMVKLTGLSWEECAGDKMLQDEMYEEFLARIPFQGMDQFETCLCDFNSLVKGRYYVGADIDMIMTQLPTDSDFWELRETVFSRNLLGELQPENERWHGIRKPLLKRYRLTGEI